MKPSRQARAATALRTGLAWRGGRPRWEPSPSSRKAGLHGCDLKHADGRWFSHGEAIDLAQRRALWAALIRDAAAGGPRQQTAREDLHQALRRLAPPSDDAAAHRRALLQDLIGAAAALLGAPPQAPAVNSSDYARSLQAMVDGYFADVAARQVTIAASTERYYRAHSLRLLARFGAATPAVQVNRGKLVKWYRELQTEGLSLSNANQCLGATGAFFRWATRQDPPWIETSPATELGLTEPAGRLVFWTADEERAYVAFLDGRGLADLADAIVMLLWTGASPVDACKANLAELAGETWRYSRQKTGIEGLPAITPPLRARIERRKSQAVTALASDGGAPFLLDPRTGRRHTPATLGALHLKARDSAVNTGALPEAFIDKRLQDCRDTCLTRLFLSGVDLKRIFPWTAHGEKAIERVARAHYLVLMEQGSLDMADKLMDWAKRAGMGL